MSGSSSVLSYQLFMKSALTESPFLVHRANLITRAYSMEGDHILPAQPVDGEKQLCVTEIRSPDHEVINHEHLIALKHVQNGLVCLRISYAHDLFLRCHHIVDCKRAHFASSAATPTRFLYPIIVSPVLLSWSEALPWREPLSPLATNPFAPDFRPHRNGSIGSRSQPFHRPTRTSQPQARHPKLLRNAGNSFPVPFSLQ